MRCVRFCKQKTAYDMRISDWSSDVCSSDLRKRRRLRRVDRPDPGMGMRAAQDPAPDHPGHRRVGGVCRPAGDRIGAVGPDGALADPLVVLAGHFADSLMSAAVSRTARTILS